MSTSSTINKQHETDAMFSERCQRHTHHFLGPLTPIVPGLIIYKVGTAVDVALGPSEQNNSA